MNIGIVVFDGADEIDFIGPYEVLRAVERAGKGAQVSLLSVEPQAEITSGYGLKLRPDGSLGANAGGAKLDMIIVPGGGWIDRSPKGAWTEAQRGVLPKKIKELHAAGTIIAGVCAGTMLLAAAGILDGRPAITHQRIVHELQATKAQVVQARVVDAGDVITCGGVTASLDLAFWIVERFWGEPLAAGIAKFMEYTRSRDVYVVSAKTA
jgi:transcriptional regulator GlxA family with amidase domain